MKSRLEFIPKLAMLIVVKRDFSVGVLRYGKYIIQHC